MLFDRSSNLSCGGRYKARTCDLRLVRTERSRRQTVVIFGKLQVVETVVRFTTLV